MNGEKIVRAEDVMKKDFILVDGMETIKEALDRVREKKARCIVVRKRHEDDEYGILLLSDVAKHIIARKRAPDRVNVYEVMSKPVISIRPNMDIRYVARLFENFGLTMAPVLHRSEVSGVVGYEDIALHQAG